MTVKRFVHRIFSKVDTLSNVAIAMLMIGFSLVLVLLSLVTRSINLPSPLPKLQAKDGFSRVFLEPLSEGVFELVPPNESVDASLAVSLSGESEVVLSRFADELMVESQPVDDAWLSVPNLLLMYKGMSEELTQRFPEKASQIQTNNSIISTELSKIDAKYRGRLSAHAGVGIVFSDASVGYLARDYSLLLVDQIDPEAGTTSDLSGLSSNNQILYLPRNHYEVFSPLTTQIGAGFYTPSSLLSPTDSLSEVVEYNLQQLLRAFEAQSDFLRELR